MDEAKKKALESAGFQVGDAADFLNMTPRERELLDSLSSDERRKEVIDILSAKDEDEAAKAFARLIGSFIVEANVEDDNDDDFLGNC